MSRRNRSATLWSPRNVCHKDERGYPHGRARHRLSTTDRGVRSKSFGNKDIGEGHPLLGRRMPDLDLVTPDGTVRVSSLLHDAKPILLNLGEPWGCNTSHWADRVTAIDAKYAGDWELPALGRVAAPAAVLIRPDGYVAWVGDGTEIGLGGALTTWFGSPTP